MQEKDYKSVDIAVHINSSLETMALYQSYVDRGWTYKQDMSGPLKTIGKWSSKPVCVAPLIHVINGVRVLYVEATSVLVDWDMIDVWIKAVTENPDIKIQCEPSNLGSDIQGILWQRENPRR